MSILTDLLEIGLSNSTKVALSTTTDDIDHLQLSIDDSLPFGSHDHLTRLEYVSFIITILAFIIGITGNLFLLIGNGYVLRNSRPKSRTFENFLIEIACFDTIVLIYHLINNIIRHQNASTSAVESMTGLINISTFCCKLMTYTIRIAMLMSHWLIVLLLLNRLLLVYSKFQHAVAIVNAKYAVLAMLFLFSLFNVPTIESMSFNEPIIFHLNETTNFTFYRNCLINSEMDLELSFKSTVVMINVFLFNGFGLILPTILILLLSLALFRKGCEIWHQLNNHTLSTENVSLRFDSPIAEFLRTYNSAFSIGIIFFLLSVPCKILRLIIIITDSTTLLIHSHRHLNTIGHLFELSLYIYKFYVYIFVARRFRCALKYLMKHHQSRTTTRHLNRNYNSRSLDSVPFDALYKHLQTNEFDSPINLSSSRRSSYKTRSSLSSRKTREDEISL
ncbi:unnamed protein product [Didymodactylos carnosus]|uniref:G-protein coupled receptors family 1 profile domain-containing protein n=1 Tax=Didymodactylos carnosus TaxID=1234261 RepID=A0A814LH23_9BILA|nr:unnamed protein product [Didymodactylos carnosus]CAF1064156.1 unnamed protein product [Didymodactylos carnosus]CAF3701190.1 unnamed protein product [Didymodactylos carnosus]CAF3832099.1 unnamed protein product [Didymodactylos carnosus]